MHTFSKNNEFLFPQLRDMCYFLTILFIPVTCYGIVRQTVLFQNKEVSWHLRLRNIWYYPYWNIYGELFAEEIDRKFNHF